MSLERFGIGAPGWYLRGGRHHCDGGPSRSEGGAGPVVSYALYLFSFSFSCLFDPSTPFSLR